MEQKEFKVGQVWKRRGGGTETIHAVLTDGAYPIIGRVTSYTREGKCYSWGDSSMDLVELVQDAPEKPAPAKEFKVGQVWKRRDGGTETIRAIRTDGVYPVTGSSGWLYTRTGDYLLRGDSDSDLVELVQDVITPPPAAPNFSPYETLSATARAAIKSAIVELQGQAAHAADERDAALTRFEEAAARQREKALAAIELGTLLVRMPESTD